jgi:hypothetical protein
MTRNYFLYPADDAVFEHHLDTVRVIGRFCQEFLNDAFGQLSRSLILFLDHPDEEARTDVRTNLSAHGAYFFFVIFMTTLPRASAA